MLKLLLVNLILLWYLLLNLPLTVFFERLMLETAGRGSWILSLSHLKLSVAEVALSSLTEIWSDSCGKQKHIYRFCTREKNFSENSISNMQWNHPWSSNLHTQHRPVIKPISVLSEMVSVRSSVGHASYLACPAVFPLNVTFPICTSHKNLTWQAHCRFLVPLTSLVTEYMSCLEITSGLFSV